MSDTTSALLPRLRATLACLFSACLLAVAAPTLAETRDARIVNGEYTHAFPATGALLVGSNPDAASSWCSGTLIGCNTFLTAAHCIEDSSDPGSYFVYFQHAGTFSVTSLHSHPSYSFPTADVAVVKLGETVTGITPVPLNTGDNPQSHYGTRGQIAGFGRSGGSNADYGLKRWGEIVTSSCTGSISNDELICWDFTNPMGPVTEDSNTCNGDSGGPLFLDLGNGRTVAGITSGGSNGSCLPTDNSYDANVYNYQSFILTHLGSDSTSLCGTLPAVSSEDVTVTGFNGSLASGSESTKDHSISIAAGVSELRISMNSEDNGSLDADLYVKYGSAPTTSVNDCARAGSGPHGTCIFESPVAGTWHILARRASGSGNYQVTTTEFVGDPPVCGNDTTESGEDCDGTDDSACDGLCQVDCTCPAPVCGNNIVESGEACDGTEAGSCPTGTCGTGCACPDPFCGNDVVEGTEECDGSDDDACPGECGTDDAPDACSCPTGCGDGVCGADETAANCAADCGCAAANACGGQAPDSCYCDEFCEETGDCCPDSCESCGVGCHPNEGGTCEGDGAMQKARLTLTRTHLGVGEQHVTFVGEIAFPGPLAGLDPLANGVQILIEDEGSGQEIVNLTAETTPVPAGTPPDGCDPKDGWKVNGKGTVWTYRNKSGAYDPGDCTSGQPGQLTVKIIDKIAKKGVVKVVVKAKFVTALAPTPNLRGTVALSADPAAMNGACGDYRFESNDCNWNGSATTLRCS